GDRFGRGQRGHGPAGADAVPERSPRARRCHATSHSYLLGGADGAVCSTGSGVAHLALEGRVPTHGGALPRGGTHRLGHQGTNNRTTAANNRRLLEPWRRRLDPASCAPSAPPP